MGFEIAAELERGLMSVSFDSKLVFVCGIDRGGVLKLQRSLYSD